MDLMNQLTLLAFESLQRPVARLQLRGSGRHGRRPSTEEETNLSTSVLIGPIGKGKRFNIR